MARFIDEAKIYVRSGNGGKGTVSFRREKFVPFGGPDGGDGGNGADVIFVANRNLTSLLDFRYKRHYKAEHGGYGKGKNKHGKTAPDLLIPVPVGTIIRDFESQETLGDLTHHNQRFTIAKGGRGGRGNARFATATNQTPRHAQPGEQGEEQTLSLELKLLADVGILGFPNAGKSTLISKISAARPKIADYPFTTIVPNLGVVGYDEGRSFVVADIPGLIKGAHKGVGLGIAFLKHIERTRVLIHLLDLSDDDERDPIEDYISMNEELGSYGHSLDTKIQIIAANKIDMPDNASNLEKLKEYFADKDITIFPISSLTGEGVDTLVREAGRILDTMNREEQETEENN